MISNINMFLNAPNIWKLSTALTIFALSNSANCLLTF